MCVRVVCVSIYTLIYVYLVSSCHDLDSSFNNLNYFNLVLFFLTLL